MTGSWTAVTHEPCRPHRGRHRWFLLATLTLMGVMGHALAAMAQQAQGSGSWPSQVERQSTGGSLGAPANTTVVPRSSADPTASANLGEVTLTAFLTEDGQRIDQGLVWRAFQEQPGTPAAKPRIVGTWREANPSIRLAPGDYMINVAFGRAHMTRRLTVEAGAPIQARFVLNVGGLRVTALVGAGEPAPERAVTYDIFSGDIDQVGNRTRIVGNIRPGVIMRLNAGIYHIVSTYGDANATVRADVNVEAGKLTEATVKHPGARVTFKLVARAGGEAQAGTQWSVSNAQGDVVKESVGALPAHVLAPGAYVVTARHGGRSFRRDFTVRSGEAMQVEVVTQ